MRLNTLITSTTLLALFPGARLVSATAINNEKTAQALLSASVKLPNGEYKITNAENGHSLHYSVKDGAYNLIPASGTGSVITLKQHGGGTDLMRVSVGQQCGSAQWTYGGGGYDVAMVLYACVGSRGATGTLNTNKQKWLFVPTNSKLRRSTHFADRLDSRHFSDVASDQFFDTEEQVETVEDDDTGFFGRGMEDSGWLDHGDLVERADSTTADSTTTTATDSTTTADSTTTTDSTTLTTQSTTLATQSTTLTTQSTSTTTHSKAITTHSTTTTTHSKSVTTHSTTAAAHSTALAVHSTTLGPFYIIAYDHLYDMKTRALSSSAIKTPGGAMSTILNVWKKGNKAQEWYIHKQ